MMHCIEIMVMTRNFSSVFRKTVLDAILREKVDWSLLIPKRETGAMIENIFPLGVLTLGLLVLIWFKL